MNSKFELLISEINDSLKRFIFYKVNDKYMMEDIYQETIIQAWKKFESIDDILKFKQWIFQIARNKIKDYYRKKYKNDYVLIDFDDYKDSRLYLVQNNEELLAKNIVIKIFEDLIEKDKELLELFYITQHSLIEISNILKIPIGTVKSRLHTARKHFKHIYKSKFKKEVVIMSNKLKFPTVMPSLTINKITITPFEVDFQETRWWFYKPIENYNCLWATYDYPHKNLTSMVKMEYLAKANIHDVDCIEFSSINYNFDINQWDKNKYIMYARLTDKYVQWVAQIEYDTNGVKIFKSFMDENFDFGNIDSIKGNERIMTDEGKYQIKKDGTILTVNPNKSSGCGYYNVKINETKYKCLRVLEPDVNVLVEAFISQEGETILIRRYNSVNWALGSSFGDKPWDERFPNNSILIIDGVKYVHWYDCITEKVLK